MKTFVYTFDGTLYHITTAHNLTDTEKAEINDYIKNTPVYGSDLFCKHWKYDHRTSFGYWLENIFFFDSLNGVTALLLPEVEPSADEEIPF